MVIVKEPCVICGESRGCQISHLSNRRDIQRSKRRKMFEPFTFLCPNHHWLYDHSSLNVAEVPKLPFYFRKYYEANSLIEKSIILGRAIKRNKNGRWLIKRTQQRGKSMDSYYAVDKYSKVKEYLGDAETILKAVKGK